MFWSVSISPEGPAVSVAGTFNQISILIPAWPQRRSLCLPTRRSVGPAAFSELAAVSRDSLPGSPFVTSMAPIRLQRGLSAPRGGGVTVAGLPQDFPLHSLSQPV